MTRFSDAEIAVRRAHARDQAEAAIADPTLRPWSWWAASFHTDDGHHVGTVVIDAPHTGEELTDVAGVMIRTWATGCNPGGAVSIVGPFTEDEIAYIPERRRRRVLTGKEVATLNPQPEQ